MTDRLFVYGTLMRASQHPMAVRLRERAVYEGEARMNGRLYRVAHYPGLVMSQAVDEWVFGDVFRSGDPDLVAALDRYEGCEPGAPEPAPYRRLIQTVEMVGGGPVSAWVYIYNYPADHLPLIASGRFDAGAGD